MFGLYRHYIFPHLIDLAMNREPFAEQRRSLLSHATGDILEIGFGTGLNLPHYPAHVRHLTIVEPNTGMNRRARRRIAASPITITPHTLGAQQLPFPDHSFDTITCTWTLCSIADPAAALRECHRVLRTAGQFLFIEHGLSPDASVAKWQRRLTPINKRIADGCHLDRDIAAILRASPVDVIACDNFYLDGMPRIGGYTYRGVARRLS